MELPSGIDQKHVDELRKRTEKILLDLEIINGTFGSRAEWLVGNTIIHLKRFSHIHQDFPVIDLDSEVFQLKNPRDEESDKDNLYGVEIIDPSLNTPCEYGAFNPTVLRTTVIDKLLLPTSPKGQLRMVQMNGAGMIPTFSPGDYVLYEEDLGQYKGAGLYVVCAYGYMQVYRLDLCSNTEIIATYDDPRFQPQKMPRRAHSYSQAFIVGKVLLKSH